MSPRARETGFTVESLPIASACPAKPFPVQVTADAGLKRTRIVYGTTAVGPTTSRNELQTAAIAVYLVDLAVAFDDMDGVRPTKAFQLAVNLFQAVVGDAARGVNDCYDGGGGV